MTAIEDRLRDLRRSVSPPGSAHRRRGGRAGGDGTVGVDAGPCVCSVC